jgi:hypothetical protein
MCVDRYGSLLNRGSSGNNSGFLFFPFALSSDDPPTFALLRILHWTPFGAGRPFTGLKISTRLPNFESAPNVHLLFFVLLIHFIFILSLCLLPKLDFTSPSHHPLSPVLLYVRSQTPERQLALTLRNIGRQCLCSTFSGCLIFYHDTHCVSGGAESDWS